jgi:hypothetical protein
VTTRRLQEALLFATIEKVTLSSPTARTSSRERFNWVRVLRRRRIRKMTATAHEAGL